MSDLELIHEIEKKLGFNLNQISQIEFHKTRYELEINRSYVLSEDNKIITLSLDAIPQDILSEIDLSQLKDVEYLSLKRCNLLDISFLKEFKRLTDLDLNSNQLNDVSILKELKGITKLDLSSNDLHDVSILGELKGLSSLYLSFNTKIEDYSFLKELKGLTSLLLSHVAKIEDYSFLNELSLLEYLSLAGQNLSDISFLKKLVRLTFLNLSSNDLSDVSILKELKGLTCLYLSFNTRIEDYSFLKEIRDLSNLSLVKNNLSDISFLKELKELTKLDLSFNYLNDISFLIDFKGLKELNLNSNNFIDVSFLKGLDNLSKVYLFDNPLIIPPKEIAEQGIEAIRNYFRQLEEQGTDYVYEAKLMLVGEPGAGKSTLMNKMFDKGYLVPNDKQDPTLGIDVRQNWTFLIENNIEFKANIWDFGGQHIQYMLHQFFLTPDCLYVLMAEKRKELANFDYWLNIIKLLGKNSPIIILFNEIRLNTASSFIFNETKYRQLFPELEFVYKDIDLSNMQDGRFDVLINEIKEKLKGLKHIGKPVPAKWIDIRKELERIRNRKFINITEYFDICRKYNINNDEDSLLILNTFHKLGTVLNFYEDPNLRDTIFLDHNWTVDAIYSVLSDKDENIRKKDGVFKRDEVYEIWKMEGYNYNEQTKLLQLMLKDNFDVCYKVPESLDEYIVPLLLPKKKSEYIWEDNDNLQFRFQYPFMPDGIINKLIIRLHEYIENRLVWNEGVVLQKNEARAQIIETKTIKEGVRIIDIRLMGNPNYRKELLILIREEIRKIQKTSFPNLPYYEMVPCICSECTVNIEPEFYDYNGLENFLFNKKKYTEECPRSGEDKSITDMIDAVYEKKDKEKKVAQIEGNTYIEQQNVFQGKVGNVIIQKDILQIRYENNPLYSKEQFEELKQALSKITYGNLKEIMKEVHEIEDLKTDEEKETFGKKILSRLRGFGVHVVEHMTAIGAIEALKYIYLHYPNLLS